MAFPSSTIPPGNMDGSPPSSYCVGRLFSPSAYTTYETSSVAIFGQPPKTHLFRSGFHYNDKTTPGSITTQRHLLTSVDSRDASKQSIKRKPESNIQYRDVVNDTGANLPHGKPFSRMIRCATHSLTLSVCFLFHEVDEPRMRRG